jgi:hypothetical protein
VPRPAALADDEHMASKNVPDGAAKVREMNGTLAPIGKVSIVV